MVRSLARAQWYHCHVAAPPRYLSAPPGDVAPPACDAASAICWAPPPGAKLNGTFKTAGDFAYQDDLGAALTAWCLARGYTRSLSSST